MAEAQAFAGRLVDRVAATSPLCAGIDPSSKLLASWGLGDDAGGLEAMGRSVVEAVAGTAAAIKPQVAYFERHGSEGYRALERVIAAGREAGLLVVADAKRNDIDATMSAYAQAWLSDESALAVDALTVSAYLGLGAMEDCIEMAKSSGRGLFCVVASSNPEGRALQEAVTASGRRVEEELLAELGARNAEEMAVRGGSLGSLGAVVGATRSAGSLDLSSLRGPYLVPGVGAQGATAEDVGELFAGCPAGSVLVNASRSVLAEGPDPVALAAAASELAAQLSAALAG